MFLKRKNKNIVRQLEFKSPLNGTAVPLSTVPDEAFASGMMGKGLAIEPTMGQLVAPFDATVAHVIKSKHAIMLEHESGLQFLLHIGINTVSLKGEGFVCHVATGDQVKEGQVLIDFDMNAIQTAGYSCITAIIVTNADEKLSSLETASGPVQAGKDIILTAVLL